MQSSFFVSRPSLLVLLLGLIGWVAPVDAQTGSRGAADAPSRTESAEPAESSFSDEQVREALQAGESLERQRRWGEAILHYEEARREFPGHPEVERRLSVSRSHFDLDRRYADASFVRSLSDLSEQKTLDMYSEVLLKLQTHYVESPDWQALLRRGTDQFVVALTEPTFVARHIPNAPADSIQRFANHLHEQLDRRPVPNRFDSRNVVAWVAALASQELGLTPQAAVQEYIAGTTGSLDDYSGLLTPNQLDEVFSQIEGNFVGLGIEIKSDEESLLIVDVIPGGPAADGGMAAGDRIVSVDGRTTRDLTPDAAADQLKGPEGSTVTVGLKKVNGETQSLRLVRRVVDVPSVVDVKLADEAAGIGYLRITSFQKTTAADVDRALWELHRRGMKSLMIDVRGNPGGLLNSAVEIADKFLPQGPIVSTRGRSSRENFDYTAHSVGTWRVPLVVLIDGDSASASEIFAGAIHDHRRGTVVGERSFGKGSVQGIFPFDSSRGGLRLTTAKFYSPSGQAISQRGVQPDVVVRSAAKPIIGGDGASLIPNGTDDVVLKAALQVARNQLAQR